jgi:hypothetical protein
VTTLETSIALDQIGGEKFDGARFRVQVEKKRNEAQIALDGRILQLPRETGSGQGNRISK